VAIPGSRVPAATKLSRSRKIANLHIGSRDCKTSGNACKSHAVNSFPLGQIRGLGRDALGLSHLTYETARRISLHLLDLPPFPCAVNLDRPPLRVKRLISRECKVARACFILIIRRFGCDHQLCSHSSSRPMRTGVLKSSLRRASVNSSWRGPSATMRPPRIRMTR